VDQAREERSEREGPIQRPGVRGVRAPPPPLLFSSSPLLSPLLLFSSSPLLLSLHLGRLPGVARFFSRVLLVPQGQVEAQRHRVEARPVRPHPEDDLRLIVA